MVPTFWAALLPAGGLRLPDVPAPATFLSLCPLVSSTGIDPVMPLKDHLLRARALQALKARGRTKISCRQQHPCIPNLAAPRHRDSSRSCGAGGGSGVRVRTPTQGCKSRSGQTQRAMGCEHFAQFNLTALQPASAFCAWPGRHRCHTFTQTVAASSPASPLALPRRRLWGASLPTTAFLVLSHKTLWVSPTDRHFPPGLPLGTAATLLWFATLSRQESKACKPGSRAERGRTAL